MKTYYVVQDYEGFWITETPDSTDIISHTTTNHSEAEQALYLCLSRSD